ncbi:hypothetical protein RB195_013757 [Necator americanus]|uniref:ABC-2 type transporter n=1 Tax=Necator americanus TaxID=51031 RepID=A0ABR1DX06_NECAM
MSNRADASAAARAAADASRWPKKLAVHFAVNSFVSIMLSMVFRWLCLRSLRFPTEAAVAMCLIGYVMPFSMVVFAPYISVVSDAETNDKYVNYTIPDLHKYTTAVGTEVAQALTVQSIVPLVSQFPASSMFVLAQIGLISSYTYSYIIIPCLSISSFVDPIVTIHYVVPFRIYIRRTLGMTVEVISTAGATPTHGVWRGSGYRSTDGVIKSRSSLF